MLFAPSGKGRKRQKKGEKGRKRAKKAAFGRKGGQTPLKPPFVKPPFAAAQINILILAFRMGLFKQPPLKLMLQRKLKAQS